MADYPIKEVVATDAKPSHHFPMEATNLTTTGVMTPSLVLGRYFPRTFHGKIDVNTFTRCVPMPAPVMSQMVDNNRFFFVPCRALWPSWYNFITDTADVNSGGVSVVNSVPYFDAALIVQFFAANSSYSIHYTGSDPDNEADFYNENDTKYYQFTAAGSRLYSILHTLGYDLFCASKTQSIDYSALPLLAFCKVIADWYFPSNYALMTTNYVVLDTLLHTHGSYQIQANEFGHLMSLFTYVTYDSDRFVDAWDNPVAPNSGLFSYQSFPDITMLATGSSVPLVNNIVTQNNGTPTMTPSSVSGAHNFSQYDISMLKALTKFTRRHQLVGGRAVDRWLADFGLGLSPAKVNRSIYLGSNVAPIQFADVMSHSDTSGAGLGDYAGKGSGFINSKSIDFDFGEDDGFLIVVNTTIPKVGYCDGYHPQVRALRKSQYYLPTFDGIGTEPIEVGEVCNNVLSPYTDNNTTGTNQERIFGFTPRYSWMKSLQSIMSGNFMARRYVGGLDEWHLFRRMGFRFETSPGSSGHMTYPRHSINFTLGFFDSYQYYRIFNTQNPGDGDPFVKVHHISIDGHMNALPLYDDYLLSHGSGKKVKVRVNGETMN